MDQQNTYYSRLLQQFFNQFQSVVYHGVPICHFVYRQLMSHLNFSWAKKNPVIFQAILKEPPVKESDLFHWFDQPYPYDAHPDGVILMRGGFGDIATAHLPKERILLISPNQAEVELIKLNRPDLTSQSIDKYYRENPVAIQTLNHHLAEVIRQNAKHPIWGSAGLLQWFMKKTAEIVRILDAVDSLFKGLNIGAVLTVSSTYSMDGALNLIARANRIPSFTLQHGLMADNDLFAHIPILATKKMVWGKATQDWYQRFGYPTSRVTVTGSPRFDIIFQKKWLNKAKLCQVLQIPTTQKIVVYATQILRIAQTVTSIVLEGLTNIPNLFIIILLHPGENPHPHQELVKKYANCKVVQFGHISLYDALSGSDLFVTCYSTAALEAMLFKIPVVTVEPSRPTFSFGALGASLQVTNATELKQVVTRLISDGVFKSQAIVRYQKFISDYCVPDGEASKRLFQEVKSLCHTGGIA